MYLSVHSFAQVDFYSNTCTSTCTAVLPVPVLLVPSQYLYWEGTAVLYSLVATVTRGSNQVQLKILDLDSY